MRAFESVVRAYQPRVFSFLRRLVGREAVASELSQETFLRLYTSIAGYREGAPARPWIFRIARNLGIDFLRRAERSYAQVSEVDDLRADVAGAPAGSPYRAAEARESIEHLEAAPQKLKPADREALLLRTVDGLSYVEIAEVMGRSVEGVKSRYLRARVALRGLMSVVDT